ncbi:hypothetical protein MAR_021497, partial [Mya arenaria]
ATTLHRYSGIDDGRFSTSAMKSHILNSVKHAYSKITDVLIIDECSFISEKTFDSVPEGMSIIRAAQMILCEEFLQIGSSKGFMTMVFFALKADVLKQMLHAELNLKMLLGNHRVV